MRGGRGLFPVQPSDSPRSPSSFPVDANLNLDQSSAAGPGAFPRGASLFLQACLPRPSATAEEREEEGRHQGGEGEEEEGQPIRSTRLGAQAPTSPSRPQSLLRTEEDLWPEAPGDVED